MDTMGFESKHKWSYEEAIEKVTTALKAEGFGVLTNIDVKDTMKKKISVDFKKYAILGACNPTLAHRSLSTNPLVGLLLPCNVIVYEDGEEAVVNIVNPFSMFQFIPMPELEPVAAEAHARLTRVHQALITNS